MGIKFCQRVLAPLDDVGILCRLVDLGTPRPNSCQNYSSQYAELHPIEKYFYPILRKILREPYRLSGRKELGYRQVGKDRSDQQIRSAKSLKRECLSGPLQRAQLSQFSPLSWISIISLSLRSSKIAASGGSYTLRDCLALFVPAISGGTSHRGGFRPFAKFTASRIEVPSVFAALEPKKSILLTGATGLLGQYLLRDLIIAGHDVTVLVRPRRSIDTRYRIGGILHYWEEKLGRSLSRPRVLSGDLKSDGLSLSSSDKGWIRDRIDTILHCAASIRFQPDERNVEPMESNFHGMKRLLRVAQELKVRHFHHISTAYVSGTRSGLIAEEEATRTHFNNAYEESKYLAELELLRAKNHFETTTIYRPSVIIGDSDSGFSSTFHTIYSCLRFLRSIPQQNLPRTDWLMNQLRLDGTERKNLVPVDWVSSSITSLIGNPETRGRIYHLTNNHPVPAQTIALGLWEASIAEPDGWTAMANDFPTLEVQQAADSAFDAFQGYFRDDAEFKTSNLEAALPNQACPIVDSDMLIRCFRYAIRQRMQTMVYPVSRNASRYTPIDKLERSSLSLHGLYRLELVGNDGGVWIIHPHRNNSHAIDNGITHDTVLVRTSRSHWESLKESPNRLQQSLQNLQLLVLQTSHHGKPRLTTTELEADLNTILAAYQGIDGTPSEIRNASSNTIVEGMNHA